MQLSGHFSLEELIASEEQRIPVPRAQHGDQGGPATVCTCRTAAADSGRD